MLDLFVFRCIPHFRILPGTVNKQQHLNWNFISYINAYFMHIIKNFFITYLFNCNTSLIAVVQSNNTISIRTRSLHQFNS